MDVSPVRSNAKCSSDFSIERILSNESGTSRGQADEAPSWLCCTRYQPPRLPRSVNTACRARRSGRHARVPFTAAQAAALEAAYARAPYLAPPALRALAAALQLRDDRIKIWFQNRRARERREKNSAIVPPREVALPPTSLIKPQGLTSNPGHIWANPRTELNMSHNVANPFILHNESRIQFDEPTNDYPRDLTVPTSSSYHSHMKTEIQEYERADSPLDIETIED